MHSLHFELLLIFYPNWSWESRLPGTRCWRLGTGGGNTVVSTFYGALIYAQGSSDISDENSRPHVPLFGWGERSGQGWYASGDSDYQQTELSRELLLESLATTLPPPVSYDSIIWVAHGCNFHRGRCSAIKKLSCSLTLSHLRQEDAARDSNPSISRHSVDIWGSLQGIDTPHEVFKVRLDVVMLSRSSISAPPTQTIVPLNFFDPWFSILYISTSSFRKH